MHNALALLLLFNLQSVPDVESGLEAIEEGRPLGRVSAEIGREAVKRIRPTTAAAEVEGLIKLALAANARYTLDRKLEAQILERGAGAWASARALAAFPDKRRQDVLERVPTKPWVRELRRMLRRRTDDATDAAILTLLLPKADLKQIRALFDSWRRSPRLSLALKRLDHCRGRLFPALFQLLLESRFNEEQAPALRIGYRTLAGHPDVAKALVEQLERRRLGPFQAFLHAAPGLPPQLWERVERTVLNQLEADRAEDRAAAIRIAGELLCVDIVEELPLLTATSEATVVRVAAVDALGHIGYRDAPTIDLLIRLLADADQQVAQAAYRQLLRKAALKIKLPLRRRDWLAWRSGQTLPAEPPEAPKSRLTKLRAQRQKQFQLLQERRFGAEPPTKKTRGKKKKKAKEKPEPEEQDL